MTTEQIDYVAYGPAEAMILEVGAHDHREAVPNELFYVLIIGAVQYATETYRNISEAKTVAKEIAKFYGVKATRVA